MNDFEFLLYAFLIGNVILFVLIKVLNKMWYFWDVKNCVDVQVFYLGDNTIKRRYINCLKTKKNTESGFETYELRRFPFGSDTFDFNTKFCISRTDGKDTIDFVDIQGKKIPLMPNCIIDGEKTISKYNLPEITKQEMDAIVEFTIRDNQQKIKNATKQKQGMTTFQIIAIVISIVLIGGLLIYYFMTKKGTPT